MFYSKDFAASPDLEDRRPLVNGLFAVSLAFLAVWTVSTQIAWSYPTCTQIAAFTGPLLPETLPS